jgi:hypothetical protein
MSDVSIIAGGPPSASAAVVSADQETILGNGTSFDPLRVNPDFVGGGGGGGGGGGVGLLTFPAANGVGVSLIPGLAVVTGAPMIGGLPSIFALGGRRAPRISGLVTSVTGGVGVVQFAGVVELTTVQWDAVVTGQVGGLQVGLIYYVDMIGAHGDFGRLVSTQPVGLGDFVIQVGLSIGPTRLLLGAPFPFTQN